MTKKELLKAATDKFLGWRLPEHFHPDAGISFTPTYRSHDGKNYIDVPHQPIGTNLFCADQAEAMLEFCVGEIIEDLINRAEAAETERNSLKAVVDCYESALTCDVPRMVWGSRIPARQISTEKVVEILKERDTLKERIAEAEKQYPIAWRAYDRQGWWIVGATKQDALDRCGRGDDRRCEPLYSAPIPSHDTQELIRKAVEDEREACAKISESTPTTLLLNGTFMSERIANAIRSRSTKEK